MFVLTTFLFLVISINSYAEEIIRIANGEWEPFYSENLKYYGLDSRIVTESFGLEGIKVKYGFFPWARSYALSKKGTYDGAIGWPYSKEREKFHYYSKHPINEGKWVFFYRKDLSFYWNNINDLKKFKIGITQGDWVMDGDDKFTKALRDGKLEYERVPMDELNFQKLFKGRIDIFPQQLEVGYEQINKLFSKEDAAQLTHHPKPFRKMALYLLLSKKIDRNRHLVELFDKGFKKLKESGRYDQFIEDFRQGK